MIRKTETLKRIKEKVDSRTSGKISLKKVFSCSFVEGICKKDVKRRITKLIKHGNSVLWMDDTNNLRNINILDTKDLHKILWQLLSIHEKKEIAYNHFIEKMTYLT